MLDNPSEGKRVTIFYFYFQIYRDFDLRCFLYANPIMTNLVQYEFEPILEVKVR